MQTTHEFFLQEMCSSLNTERRISPSLSEPSQENSNLTAEIKLERRRIERRTNAKRDVHSDAKIKRENLGAIQDEQCESSAEDSAGDRKQGLRIVKKIGPRRSRAA